MRIVILATAAAAIATASVGIDPAAAQHRDTIVNEAPYPLPDVRIRRPMPRSVIVREVPFRNGIGQFDTRDYRVDPVTPDYGSGVRHEGYVDDVPYPFDDDLPFEDEYADSDRDDRRGVSYGDARDIDYDRDYPYDYPYGGGNAGGGYAGGGYTVTETITTTTTPTVIKQIEYVDRPVAVHKPARYKKTRRLRHAARRSVKAAPRCNCR